MWWSSPDGEGYDVAGFANDGVGVAMNDHFSDVVAGDARCPDADPERRCRGCIGDDDDDDVPEEQDTCVSCADDPDCETSRSEECRRLCFCESYAVGLSFSRLCQTREINDRTSTCEPDPALPTADGAVFLGISNGNLCSGTSWEPQTVSLCGCEATTANGPADRLCPVPWRNLSPGSNNWVCESTLAWGSLEDEHLPPPQAPIAGDGDLLKDRKAYAYVEAGADGGACEGHWLDRRQRIYSIGGLVTGSVVACNLPEKVDYRWRSYPGNAAGCRDFEWPDDVPIVPLDETQESICRTRREDRTRLAQMRAACNVPARVSDAEERATRDQERAAGVPKAQRTRNHTLAILEVAGEPESTFVGVNRRARTLRPANDNSCPHREVTQPWPFIGSSKMLPSGFIVNNNVTLSHAEGEALMMLAEQRGRTAGPKSSLVIPEGGPDGGCAVLLVDREPCGFSCAREGIHTAAFAAGLDTLIVRSPNGCRRFERANYFFRGGMPCASDDEACP